MPQAESTIACPHAPLPAPCFQPLVPSPTTLHQLPGHAIYSYHCLSHCHCPNLQITPSRNRLSEAVIGSLPRPLSLAERKTISESMKLSSTLTRLGSLPSQKVLSRNEEGVRLRRRVLKGAVLVFITAGYAGELAPLLAV